MKYYKSTLQWAIKKTGAVFLYSIILNIYRIIFENIISFDITNSNFMKKISLLVNNNLNKIKLLISKVNYNYYIVFYFMYLTSLFVFQFIDISDNFFSLNSLYLILLPIILFNYFFYTIVLIMLTILHSLFNTISYKYLILVIKKIIITNYSGFSLYYTEVYTYFNSFFNNSVIFFSEVFNNYTNYPIFILFAVLFFLTSFFSLLSLSYLGFYGVFILNFATLFLLWASIIPYTYSIFKLNNFYYINLGKWIYLNTNYKINFDFLIDNVSLSFSFLTLSIAVFVYLYAFAYFRYEPLVDRLIIFLSLFIISMVFLVSSANFVMLFLGWELIGLTSFFLINFWSTRAGTLKAAFKAFSFNKTSDLFLFFAILLVYNLTFNLDIATFLVQISYYKNYMVNFLVFNLSAIDLIAILFLGCAFIKSAQIGAHIWLPDSMEAPVPASSLIHSATLVSAGIFLLLRFSALFELSDLAFYIIAIVGSVTAFYGGLVSMYQSDTKRILAYSTISHCGFLMVIYTTGVIEYVMLYLYIHGFFKAAVFMSVGNVNRFSRNNQDFKKMGNYYKYLPFDCFMCFIGLINLSGLPFTLGFYIKHLLFIGLNSNVFLYLLVLVNCLFGAFTGLFYSYRLFYNVFFDFKKAKKKLYQQAVSDNLNSKYYSNTVILGNSAIIGLLLCSYIVSIFLFYIYISNDYNFSNFSTFIHYSSYIDNIVASKNFLYNVSYINWIVIILLYSIFFTPWRKLSNSNYFVYNSLFINILFVFLFAVFLVIFNL